MRDTDRDRQSFVVVPAASAIKSGRATCAASTVAVGALDSPQATLIPLGLLQRAGLEPGRDVTVKRFDVLVGKHGDHVGGELDAFRCLERGEADASTVLDLKWKGWTRDGTADPARWRDPRHHRPLRPLRLHRARRTSSPSARQRWLDALFSMSYDNPDHRKMMDMEGLRQWLPGRTTGFGPLSEAVERQGFFAAERAPPTDARSAARASALSGHHGRELAAPAGAAARAARASGSGRARRPRSSTASPTRRSLDVLRRQEEAGVDLVTDGELRRDNFFSFVAEKLDGVELMTLAEMLDMVEDKAAFELHPADARRARLRDLERGLRGQDRAAPAARGRRPAVRRSGTPRSRSRSRCRGRTCSRARCTCRSVSRAAYATKEDLGADVARVLRAGGRGAGAPRAPTSSSSTSRCSPSSCSRTGAPAPSCARRSPSAATRPRSSSSPIHLMNEVLDGAALGDTRIGLHVCRGNWSRDESILLRGGYHPLAPYLERMTAVRQLVLEYATERAGDLMRFEGKELGLGVVNPRTDRIESPDEIARRVERALELYPPERIWLNPDCGFGTFSNRPVNDAEIATRKLEAMVAAARLLRGACRVACSRATRAHALAHLAAEAPAARAVGNRSRRSASAAGSTSARRSASP